MREPAFSYIDAMRFIDAPVAPHDSPSAAHRSAHHHQYHSDDLWAAPALALSFAALLGAKDDVWFPVQQNNARLGPL
tara:strand:- start:536 stop:766 length:231 start_codon:yes stop_codon:yes gene_type:complete